MKGSILRCAILGAALAAAAMASAQGAGKAPSAPAAPAIQPLDPGLLGAEAARQESVEGGLKKASVDLGQSTIQYFTAKPAAELAGAYPPTRRTSRSWTTRRRASCPSRCGAPRST
jgi:hypothetical protein